MMTPPPIRLTLDNAAGPYYPGDRLTGRYMAEGMQVASPRAAELSVLWYTAGKGDEDMAVHHFERIVDEPTRPLDLRVAHRFTVTLPASPLSYDGQIVKVCWCVRLRVFFPQGQESVVETPFRLGNVPAAGVEVQHSAADGEP
jgi:hypothetical protein